MFCPRCGRPVSRTANFCGGCGLPRAEIERMSQPASQPAQVDVTELDATISQLEGDLTGISPVENYTTETDVNTNNVEISLETEETEPVVLEFEDITQTGQSEYSANAPAHPMYEQTETVQENQYDYAPVEQQAREDQTLSTTDFVWMMLISGIPVIGLIYLIYLGFVQQENENKRSFARATMIFMAFGIVLGIVFSFGIMMTALMYW